MVRISKKELTKEQHTALETLLVKTLSIQKDDKDLAKILSELLTDTEHLALSRRLVSMVMLDAGKSYYSIRNAFGISVDTLKNIDAQLKNNSFRQLKKTLRHISNYTPVHKDRSIKGLGRLDKKKHGALSTLVVDIFDILPRYGESVSGYNYRRCNK